MNAALFPDLIVNGQTVPHSVVAAEAQNHDAPKGKPGIAWRKAARAVAIRTLLVQEAVRRGLVSDPREVGPGRFETDEDALIRTLLDDAIDVGPPTQESIRAEWQADPSRFRSPPLWEVSHILCACDVRDEAERRKAHARASRIAEEVAQRPGDFARIAKDSSDCGSAATGGALGQVVPGDSDPEFEAVLRTLREGQITSEPVLTRHGWHVIRMDAVAEGATLPFETVGPRIAEAMERAAWARAAKTFVSGLVAAAEISGADMDAGQVAG